MDVEILREELEEFSKENSVILLVSKSEDYQQTNLESLKFLVDKKNMPGI